MTQFLSAASSNTRNSTAPPRLRTAHLASVVGMACNLLFMPGKLAAANAVRPPLPSWPAMHQPFGRILACGVPPAAESPGRKTPLRPRYEYLAGLVS